MGLDALKNLAKKTEPKKTATKSKMIVLDPTPVKEAEEQWIKADQKIAEGKSEKEFAESSIIDYAETTSLEKCREQGKAENSCSVGRIRLTFKGKSQFATKSSLDTDRLRGAFGDEEYEYYFTEKEGPMQLTEEAVANPEIVERLTEAIAAIAQDFPDTQLITYDTQVVPKDTLFNDYVIRSDKHEDLEAKLRAAGVKRTKTTFAAR